VALEQRKIREGWSPEQARAFASGGSSLEHDVLAAIRDEFERYRSLYESKVQPIRHSVFAHAGRITREERDELFTRVFTRELERMVVFPLRLHRALFHLYSNGSAPQLEQPPTVITDVLNALPSDSTSTWEHLHAAKNAAGMVLWMKSAPVPPVGIDKDIIARLVRAMDIDKFGREGEDLSNDVQPELGQKDICRSED
jgi:hypothetical protein